MVGIEGEVIEVEESENQESKTIRERRTYERKKKKNVEGMFPSN